MKKPRAEKYSKEYGKKEKVLNYACQTYQNKEVIGEIRKEIKRLAKN